jgi:hypothetical protein
MKKLFCVIVLSTLLVACAPYVQVVEQVPAGMEQYAAWGVGNYFTGYVTTPQVDVGSWGHEEKNGDVVTGFEWISIDNNTWTAHFETHLFKKGSDQPIVWQYNLIPGQCYQVGKNIFRITMNMYEPDNPYSPIIVRLVRC